jgi:hypothetical protein
MAGAEPHVVGRALVSERGRHRIMHREVARVCKGQSQLRQRAGPFVAAVRHGHEVGGGQVAAPVGGVGRGRDRCRVGCPHRRGRHRIGAQACVRIGHGRPERGEPALVGPVQRQEDALRQPQRQIGAHLGQPLQCGAARVRGLARIGRRGEVAEAEAGEVVAGADDAVEVDLGERHRGTCVTRSPTAMPSAAADSGSMAMPPSTSATRPMQARKAASVPWATMLSAPS